MGHREGRGCRRRYWFTRGGTTPWPLGGPITPRPSTGPTWLGARAP